MVKVIDGMNKLYGGSAYLCVCCRKLSEKVNKTFRDYDALLVKYEQRLKILELENKVLAEKVGKLEGKTEQATEGIVRMETEIERGMEKAKEELGSELKEREERSANVVLYGVPEPVTGNAEQMKEEDEKKVKEMAEVMGVELKGAIERKFRAGKKDETRGKGRPMIVRIEDEETRTKMLENARKLKRNDTWKSVFVSHDLTFKQREEARKEEAKLKEEAETKTEEAKNEGKNGKFILVGQRGRRWLKWVEERDD